MSMEIRVYKYRFHIFALIFTNRSFSHKTSKQQLKNNNKVCQYLCQPYLKDSKNILIFNSTIRIIMLNKLPRSLVASGRFRHLLVNNSKSISVLQKALPTLTVGAVGALVAQKAFSHKFTLKAEEDDDVVKIADGPPKSMGFGDSIMFVWMFIIMPAVVYASLIVP